MAIASFAAIVVLKVWRANIRVPFAYSDDANLNLMLVKGILENGWYLENPKLGVPHGQQLYDFPVLSGDHLNVVLFKLLGLASSDAAAVINVFFLLTFALTALTAFVVFRRLSVSPPAALVCSCLYALLPYHFLRGEIHLFLSAYYAVPLAAYLVLAILGGHSLFTWRPGQRSRGLLGLASRRTLATVAMCVVLTSASGSFYYSGFAVVLLVAAMLLRLAITRRPRDLLTGGAVVIAILALSVVNLAPTIVYHYKHGGNPEVGQRQPFESEYYSLRLTQLILPLSSHRLDAFAGARQTYDSWTPSTGLPATEAGIAALGTIATLGFLGLVVATLVSGLGGRSGEPAPIYRGAGAASLIAFFIATMGGFSSVIGLVYPQLRAWNRLSIFIAFFALLAVATALDRAGRWMSSRRSGRPLFAGLLSVVLVLGVLDQTNGTFVPAYEETARAYESDRAFIHRIEREVPSDATVFELPYASFPESVPPPPGRTIVYDLVRPYLHSQNLRWSFGAVRGRPGDWAARLADRPLTEIVPEISAVGFDALYVDRLGYADDARATAAERELVQILDSQPLKSQDGRLLFFNLRTYNERLRRQLSATELTHLRPLALSSGKAD